MSREPVDPEKAAKAVEAVREGTLSIRHAAETFAVSKTSIHKRLKGVIPMDSKSGQSTVLTREEEVALVDSLLWAGRHELALSRSELVDAVRTLCLDGRRVPWKPETGPGPKWVKGFLKRHPVLAERNTRIFEANRVQADNEERLRKFYDLWAAYAMREQPTPDHIWNTDETGGLHSYRFRVGKCLSASFKFLNFQIFPRNPSHELDFCRQLTIDGCSCPDKVYMLSHIPDVYIEHIMQKL